MQSNIGAFIRHLSNKANLLQAQLAEGIYSRSIILEIEKVKRGPDYYTLLW